MYISLGWFSYRSSILEMLVIVEGGKQENMEKNPQSKTRTGNKLNPHMALSYNGGCFHHFVPPVFL